MTILYLWHVCAILCTCIGSMTCQRRYLSVHKVFGSHKGSNVLMLGTCGFGYMWNLSYHDGQSSMRRQELWCDWKESSKKKKKVYQACVHRRYVYIRYYEKSPIWLKPLFDDVGRVEHDVVGPCSWMTYMSVAQ